MPWWRRIQDRMGRVGGERMGRNGVGSDRKGYNTTSLGVTGGRRTWRRESFSVAVGNTPEKRRPKKNDGFFWIKACPTGR